LSESDVSSLVEDGKEYLLGREDGGLSSGEKEREGRRER